MTTVEFSNEFDIHYNSIAGQSAPGIDAYEKSVFLTKAQLEIVKNYYDALSNRKQKGFESTEKRRVDLKELIKDYKTTASATSIRGIHPSSKFFELPLDAYLLINENVKVISEHCINDTIIEVKPVTHDEYNKQIKNPFKTPDNSVAWRLDISKTGAKDLVEIVSPYNLSDVLEYRLRYIKYPSPIVLVDLATEFAGETVSIDGVTALTQCELHESVHREIVDRAVEIALRDYKPEGLGTKIQTDVRNE
jgi:hypothetical protein